MAAEKTASITIGEKDGQSAIYLEGAVDIFFAADLRQAALTLAANAADVAVCCAKLERLDTATLQILLALKKELQQKGRILQWFDLPAEPARVVGLAGLTGSLF